jgi:CBS-domain-containing membrane protein
MKERQTLKRLTDDDRMAALGRAVVGTPHARDLMSAPVHTLGPSDSIWDAWHLLSSAGVRHAVVVDRRSTVLGVLDDRRILHAWPSTPVAAQRTRLQTLLGRRRVRTVTEAATIRMVARAVMANEADAVAVVSRTGKVVGIITASDLVAHLARPIKRNRVNQSRVNQSRTRERPR